MKRLLFFFFMGLLSMTAVFGQNSALLSVFFDSDKSVVKPKMQAILRLMADSVRQLPQFSLRLQGPYRCGWFGRL